MYVTSTLNKKIDILCNKHIRLVGCTIFFKFLNLLDIIFYGSTVCMYNNNDNEAFGIVICMNLT